ncbi:Bax inhibitor-1/YccA family protein [Entomobacter blattae]|nr:Bax inhibitor-1/YccA family protein [Entomobacter blattae]
MQAAAFDAGLRAYMLRVYNWMAAGLAVTGVVAYAVAHVAAVRALFFHFVSSGNGVMIRPTGLGYIGIFAPFVFVMVMSFGVNRLSLQAVRSLFWAFCAVMGISMANIFLGYTATSIARVFFITAAMFGGMSLWGYTTGKSLASFGSFLMMGLFGIVIAMLVNLFLQSSGLAFLLSLVGVFVFVGLIAYDTQRIKLSYQQFAYYEGPEGALRRSVYDALTLYLNFINLFQFLLAFMGDRQGSRE